MWQNDVNVEKNGSVKANGRIPTSSDTLPLATSQPNQPSQPPPTPQKNRYNRILRFFAGVIAQIILNDLLLARLPLVGQWIRNGRSRRFRRMAAQFRTLAIEMGGVMIKLGQFLSARVDVMPPEIIEELAGLQDEVPPEDPANIFAVLAQELGKWQNHFTHIEQKPLAAASFGQAHRAWLRPLHTHNGSDNGNGSPTPSHLSQPVVVKIQRPNIEQIVETDLAALNVVARWVQRYRPIGRRANVPALMEEFATTLREELDYIAEADNAERFAELYANSSDVYIPAVYRQHSTKHVITLENVESIKITDVAGMEAAGIDPKEVASTLLEAYFGQIFEEGFFHADPHPGNLFVRPRYDLPWQADDGPRPFWLIFVDFGMVGHVPTLMGDNLRKVLTAVTQRDAHLLTEAYDNLGFFLPGADLDRITEAQAAILDQIWGRNLLDLTRPDPKEVQELGNEFRDLLFDFPFQVPQDFVYLGRAIGMVSGMVSMLNPDINPWYYIEKFGERVLANQQNVELTWETILDRIRPYLSTPSRINRVIQAADSGQLRVKAIPDPATLRHYERLDKRLGQLAWSILGAAAMVSGTILYWLRRKKDD
ncbi:MAG: AarF/ABC1/UbiB kinase family protein [Candidatus Promineifilaceae bacterium]